jgi:hypothetical protein
MSKEYYSGLDVKLLFQLKKSGIFFLAFLIFFLVSIPSLYAGQTGFLEGRILDITESPVKKAEVYVFDSPDVKRPADFISNRTTEDGRYRVQLPSGNYWAVAILRKGEGRFGPLGYGDKHSGEPVALKISTDESRSRDFMVVNLREAARKHQKKSAELIKITGKIVDRKGSPVRMAYAMAHKMEQFGNLPDYISTWTDNNGEYTLYLKPGRYFLGASVGFPPKNDYNLYLDQQFTEDVENLDLIADNQ